MLIMSEKTTLQIVPKIALRRMLQSYLSRLDETSITLMSAESLEQNVPAVCHFCEDNIIVCHEHPHAFSPSTYTLLKQFFETPKMFLSKEDIRQDVLCDDDAKEGSVRQCILEARKELRRHQLPYRIETITRKGYRLTAEEGER
jgi:DNA-binding response OmpR family regulator